MLRYKYALYALLLALISACSNNPAIYRGDNAPAKDASYETSGNANSAPRAQSASAGERLGTQWGDEMTSRVTTVDLRRVSDMPIAQTSIRYADKVSYAEETVQLNLVN